MYPEYSKHRLFPLQSHIDFATGKCEDGRQIVMGLLCPHLVAFYFDSRGNLLGKERRLWRHPAPWKNEVYNIYDKDFEVALEQQMSEWQVEMSFHPATICVKAFYDYDDTVGIKLLPDYLDIETTGEIADEEERQEWIQDYNEWLVSGNFVFSWCQDYDINQEGEVIGT
jgi:hypothetical protein